MSTITLLYPRLFSSQVDYLRGQFVRDEISLEDFEAGVAEEIGKLDSPLDPFPVRSNVDWVLRDMYAQP